MASMEEIKAVYLIADLTDEILEKIQPMTEIRQFKEREVIYEEGDKAENFYCLKRGKILLEVEVSKQIIISLGSIKSGYSFGWSALISGSSHTSYAVCTEPCEVLIIPGNKFLELLKEDHASGYRFMNGVMKILKNRLDRRTGQFLKVMTKHPDIQKLLGL
jgi:CRP/FNR family cyclic AMP-dependent transcriptional regulator